jgi:antitoxin component of RelBE/YafQ-DinJ toxin-antitoxin module
MPRPKGYVKLRDIHLSVRLTEREKTTLTKLTKKTGASPSEIVRVMLQRAAQEHGL